MTLVLVAIATGAILVPLNSTMLAVALPSIMRDFSVSAGAVSWLVTAYLAAVAIAMPVSGSAGDRLGHRRMFLAGVGAFAMSSLLAAAAWSFPVLILSRLLQAVSGASITTNSMALVSAISTEGRRGSSFGIMEMFVSTSAASGPFLGGVLVSALGWRSLFLMAAPVAALSALLVRAIVAVPQAASIAHERRAPLPVIDVRLFRVTAFAAAVAAVFGSTVILHTSMILIPMLTQNLLDASAAASGLVLFVYFGVSALISPAGGRLSDHVGRRAPAVLGMLCTTAGLAGLWRWAGSVTLTQTALLLALTGLGSGLSGTPRQTSAIESVPVHATGMAAGTYFTGRYLGGVLGASLAAVILGSGVTVPAVARGFGVLSVVGCGVALVSLGLRGRPANRP